MNKYNKAHTQSGLTLIEIMLTIVIISLVMIGIAQFFATQSENNRQQEAQLELNENLRMAITRVSDDLRNAKFMAPATDLNAWTPWVGGFATNPNITPATGSLSDIVTMLSARATPIGFLAADVALDANSFQVDGLDDLPEGNYLISINHREFASMVNYPSSSASSATFEIDSDPLATGIQGVAIEHLMGAPVYVLETTAYVVNTSTKTFNINKYDNLGFVEVLDNITDMQITPVTVGRQYTVTLSAESDIEDQDTGAKLTRSISSDVALAN